MKKIIVIMFIVFISLVILGCNYIQEDTKSISTDIDEYIEEYVSSHGLNPSYSVDNEVEKVIAYSTNEKFGLVYFKYDDEMKKVTSQNIVSKWDGHKQVSYSQIKGEKENYIGIFIREDTILTKNSNIMVVFSKTEDDKIHDIIQTLYGEKVLITTYKSDNGLKEIQDIQLSNEDGE